MSDVSLPTRLLDTDEAADFLAIDPKTLKKWRVCGGGPVFVRVGRRVRYVLADLESYIAQNRCESTSTDRPSAAA